MQKKIENHVNQVSIKDSIGTFKGTVDETTGFLTVPVTLARTGVQEYYGYELGIQDRMHEKIGVYRPGTEVFSAESVKSFINLVSTDDHPNVPVTVSNVRALQIGTVSGVQVSVDQTVLEGILTITDEAVIKKIKGGKVEVSVGYSNDLKAEKGIYNGVAYDYVQTKIRANHLAIVDAGRCGAACRINTDHKKGVNMVITIDGIDYNTEDAQLAQAVKKAQSTWDAEKEELEKKQEEDEEEMEKLKAEKEKAEATKDALAKDKLTDDALSKLINDRAILLIDARRILGDKLPECGDCPKEIRAAVVDHVFPDMKIDGKSDAYIEGLYDMAVQKVANTKESFDALKADGKKLSDGKEITRDSLRKAHNAKIGMEV